MVQEGLLALLQRDRVDQRLALHAFQARLDHLPFRTVDHDGDAGNVRLGGDEVEIFRHRLGGIDEALVHVDVDDLRAVRHLVARDVERGRVVAGRDQLAEFRRTGDVGTLADVHEGDGVGQREGFEAGKAHVAGNVGNFARPVAGGGPGNGADMVRRRAAAAADHVDEAVAHEALDLRGHLLGALVILAEGVRQAGIRVGADEGLRDGGDFGEMGAHRIGAERAVEADGEGGGMAHRVPEGLGRLAGERAAGQVGDRARDHDRQLDALFLEHFARGEDRGLGVQRVEDRLDEDDVGAAVDEAAHLIGIGEPQVVEGDGAVAGIVDVGRDGGGAVGRAERAGDEAAPAVLLLRPQAGAAGKARAVAVEFVDHVLHAVVGLGDRCGGEGVGLEDVGAGERIAVVDVLDRARLGQRQQVVVALLVAGAVAEACSPEILLHQLQRLDFRAHRAVEHEDALAGGGFEGGADLASVPFRQFGAEQGIQVRIGHGEALRCTTYHAGSHINVSLCQYVFMRLT